MIFDIKKINDNFPNIHSRYYIDSNSVVYTSISRNNTRITVNGERRNINKFRKENLPKMNNTNKLIIEIPNSEHKYYMLNDGTILQRLNTLKRDNDTIYVHLISFDGNQNGKLFILSRLVAGSFLGSVEGKEVHHLDGDRTNNKISNLKILTFEEHRSKGKFKENHPHLNPND